tara:strand:- start:449 stop:1477 length:1029 start_codon:yes stop_codon:yes gene_type:complete
MNLRIFFIFIFFQYTAYSQIGGNNAFSFINIESSARSEAMGGGLIAIYDNDITLTQTTPSLLQEDMHKDLAIYFTDYFSDINLFGFSYAHVFKNIGVISFASKILNYGEFDLTDPTGAVNGSFTANDQVFTLGASKILNKNLSLGLNVNFLNSQYERYHSLGIFSNIAMTYHSYERKYTSTLLFKNIGRQLISYTNQTESFPFEIQVGLSKQLKHLPFRYHISYHHLNQFNISSPYKLQTQTNFETGNLEIKDETLAKTFLRHIAIGGELNPLKKSLFLRGGFNFQRRFDLSLETAPFLVGFSWGVGFRVFNFHFDYSRSLYHLSGYPNNFNISTNISTFGI